MVNGPPCGICGFTLRWMPQQSSWGCDRCQRMFPASGQGAPQASQSAPHQPSAPGQPSPWAPPGAQATSPQSPHAFQQQGFTPPQQQGFGITPTHPPTYTPPGSNPPGANPYAQPGSQPGSNPGGHAGANPYAQPGSNPGHPGAHAVSNPGANPYAQPGSHPGSNPGAHAGANPYAQPGSHPGSNPGAHAAANPYAQPNAYGQPGAHPPGANPYAPQGGAQPAYTPHPSAPPAAAMPAGGKKSSKGLVIGLAVAAVAVAGGIIAFVMLRGGGSAAGGSRSAVIKATLAALEDGDTDELVSLADPVGLFDKAIDCSGKTKPRDKEEGDSKDDGELSEKDKEERDPKKQLEKRKQEFGEIAPRTKGAKIELVEILTKEPPAPTDDEKKSEDDENRDMVFKSGQRLMKGCVAKVPWRVHSAKVKLKVTPKGEAATEQEAEVMLLQVGKGWWLGLPPIVSVGIAGLEKELGGMRDKVCACKDAACAEKLHDDFKASPRRKSLKKEIKALPKDQQDKLEKFDDEIKACEKKLGGDDQMDAMVQFKDKMCACVDKTCAEKVTQEMTVWGNSHHDALGEDDAKKMAAIGEEMGKCMQRIFEADAKANTGTGGIGATIASAGGGGDADFPPAPQLPAQCEEYRKTLATIANCPKYPQESKKALSDAWKSMQQLTTLPEASKKAIGDSCQQGADAMKQAMGSLGC